MFYSQFILAKKGPLGTIWIAAHLERKLRKNQVADTDIGFSVDSILFPEVPIALRLSSHLLLGVVRIYSRKVNYLFDDCSEALLKIKQAFRSTAVDLPPEESTAPYHSITLPETFDLDDFELPDNDIFHGNFVDHHVSSREQITLQDTMEGVVYSTSQFGLDERFGDGDTSGLDLDEELLMDKVAAEEHRTTLLSSGADPQASVQPLTHLKKDEDQDTTAVNSGTIMATGSVNQIDDFDGDADHVEYAQAPCTPGLWEEPNLSNVQETSAFDDHLESENHNLTESAMRENLENASSNLDFCNGHKGVEVADVDPTLLVSTMENGYHPGDPEINQLQPWEIISPNAVTVEQISKDKLDSLSLTDPILAEETRHTSPVMELSDKIIAASAGVDQVEDRQKEISSTEPETYSVGETCNEHVDPQGNGLSESSPHACSLTCFGQSVSESMPVNAHSSLDAELISEVEIAGNMENTCPLSNGLESNTESYNIAGLKEHETLDCQDSQYSKSLNISVLRPCTTHLNQPDMLITGGNDSLDPEIPCEGPGLHSLSNSGCEEPPHTSGASTSVQGEGSLAINDSDRSLEETDIHASSSKLNDKVDNTISGSSQVDKINSPTSSELPAPEKLLSVPEELAIVPITLLPEITPDREVLEGGDGGDAGSITLTRRKRSFAESALTVQSMDAVESSGVFGTKMTAESIPNDDDLLSSILVGRSSVLRVKPSPPPETTSKKRRRSAPRTGASKRKVLLDDTMVLHGDTIRQQLTNTEDIRRVRKKAPCTRPEISMIQKQFWEDELFTEPIFTGVSMELASLHNQAYDLTEIRISQNDASFESAINIQLVSQNEKSIHLEASNDMDADIKDNSEARPVETPVLTDYQLAERNTMGPEFCGSEVEKHPLTDVTEPRSSEHEILETTSMEIDGKVHSDADPVVTVEVESSSHPSDLVLGDTCDISACTVQLVSSDKTGEADASLQMNAPGLLQYQTMDMLSMEMDASVDGGGDTGVDTNIAAEKKDESAANEAELLSERTEDGASIEIIRDNESDCLEHTQSTVPSHETGGGSTLIPTVDQAMEEVREDDQKLMSGDLFLDAEVEYNAKNLVSDSIYGDELVINPSYSAEVNMHSENVFFDGENPSQQEAYPLVTPNAEVSTIEGDDRYDLDYAAVGHDTEFLNVDDDDEAEADGDCVPNAEEARFIDNSGWSSRTRAVAKYLQTLFDKEAERGRKVLPMDNLLAGKTRKEASRMFFETLVLKTKDFIHVEQQNPFDNVNLLPRVKLMKSDF